MKRMVDPKSDRATLMLVTSAARSHLRTATAVISGWYLLTAAVLAGWIGSGYASARPPSKEALCTVVCRGDVSYVIATGLPAVMAWTIAVGITPGLLRRRFDADPRNRPGPVRLAAGVVALGTGVAVGCVAIVCGGPMVALLHGRGT
jgi:hypothetical protein